MFLIYGKKNHLCTKKNYDNDYSVLFGIFLIIFAINLLIKQCFNNSFVDKYLSIILGVIFIVYFLVFMAKHKAIIPIIIIFELLFGFFLAYSYLANQELSSKLISRCIWAILFCIPLSVGAFYVSDWKNVLNRLKIVTFVCLIISCLNVVFYRKVSADYNYNMSLGYSILFPLLLHLYYSKNNPFYLLPAFLEILLIVLFCSRGPLLCVFAFIVLVSIVVNRNKHFFAKLILFLLAIVVFFNIKSITSSIVSVLKNFRINSRFLNVLSTNGLTYDAGRYEIYKELWPHVFDNPILGLGVCGELRFISSSPHQVFLEFLLQYGLFIGGIISFATIFIMLLASIKAAIKKDEIVFLFICGGFIKLLMSSTYLENPVFWIMISVCLQAILKEQSFFKKEEIVNVKKSFVHIS